MLGEQVTMNQALVVTVFSMAIVFLTLLVISFILDIFKIAIHDKKDKNKKQNETKTQIKTQETKNEQDEEELVAVITTAIAASIGKKSDNLIIKNIKRISDTQSAWTKAGKIELMR